MSTVPGFDDATSPTPATGILWLTEGSGSTRDKKVEAGTMVTDLLGTAVNAQAAAATPIVPATDLLPVVRGDVGGKASVDAVVEAGFAGAFPAKFPLVMGGLPTASTLSEGDTIPVVQTTAKKLSLSALLPLTVVFSSLEDILPTAVVTTVASITAQYQMVVHRVLGGPTYADVVFHWSTTPVSVGVPGCGWTIPDDEQALGPALEQALRDFWGTETEYDWPYKYLFGTLQVPGTVYPVEVYTYGPGTSGAVIKIEGWTATEETTLYPFGELRLRVPGTPVVAP